MDLEYLDKKDKVDSEIMFLAGNLSNEMIILREFEDSGLTESDYFCKNGPAYQQFRQWEKELLKKINSYEYPEQFKNLFSIVRKRVKNERKAIHNKVSSLPLEDIEKKIRLNEPLSDEEKVVMSYVSMWVMLQDNCHRLLKDILIERERDEGEGEKKKTSKPKPTPKLKIHTYEELYKPEYNHEDFTDILKDRIILEGGLSVVVNSKNEWIGNAQAARVFYEILLVEGIIYKVSHEQMGILFSMKFKGLDKSFSGKTPSFKGLEYSSSFSKAIKNMKLKTA